MALAADEDEDEETADGADGNGTRRLIDAACNAATTVWPMRPSQ